MRTPTPGGPNAAVGLQGGGKSHDVLTLPARSGTAHSGDPQLLQRSGRKPRAATDCEAAPAVPDDTVSQADKRYEETATETARGIRQGVLLRNSSLFNAGSYVRQYIQDKIDQYPGENGGLTPETQIRVEQLNYGPMSGNSEYHSLYDIVRGAIETSHPGYKMHFPAGVSDALKRALAPGSAGDVTSEYFVKGVQDQFDKDMDRLASAGPVRRGLENFYELSYRSTAREFLTLLDAHPEQAPAGLAAFKQPLADFVAKKPGAMPSTVLVKNHEVAEVVALQSGNRLLVWDAAGMYKIISYPRVGDPQSQAWLLQHMDADVQHTHRTAQARQSLFSENRQVTLITGLSPRIVEHPPLALKQVSHVGKDMFTGVVRRSRADMDALVRTQAEYGMDRLINGAKQLLNVGVTFIPGAGIGMMLVRMGLTYGVVMAAGAAKAANADTTANRQMSLDDSLHEIVTEALVPDAIPVGVRAAGGGLKKARNVLYSMEGGISDALTLNARSGAAKSVATHQGRGNADHPRRAGGIVARINAAGTGIEIYHADTRTYRAPTDSPSVTGSAATAPQVPAVVASLPAKGIGSLEEIKDRLQLDFDEYVIKWVRGTTEHEYDTLVPKGILDHINEVNGLRLSNRIPTAVARLPAEGAGSLEEMTDRLRLDLNSYVAKWHDIQNYHRLVPADILNYINVTGGTAYRNDIHVQIAGLPDSGIGSLSEMRDRLQLTAAEYARKWGAAGAFGVPVPEDIARYLADSSRKGDSQEMTDDTGRT